MLGQIAQAQLPPPIQSKVDSFKTVADSAEHDSIRILALNEWAALIAAHDDKQSRLIHEEIIERCRGILSADSLPENPRFYKEKLAEALGQLGILFYLSGNLPKALEQILDAYDAYEELGNKSRMGIALVIISAIYSNQEQFELAITYQRRALALSKESGNKTSEALAYLNLGTSYLELDSLDTAESFFILSLALYQEVEDKRGSGVPLLNLGKVSQRRGKLQEAMGFYQQSLELREQIEDRQGLMHTHAAMGRVFMKQGLLDKARYHGLESLKIAEEKAYVGGLSDANQLLFKVYEQQKDYESSFKHYKAYIEARDTISSAENIRAVTQTEYRFKYEKEMAADSIRSAEREIAYQIELELKDSEARRQKQAAYALWAGILAALAGAAYVFSRFRKARKQQKIISQQKEQVDEALATLTQRDQEKELLLKEIHHRVKNNLQVISSLLDIQSQKLEDGEALTAFNDGQSRVKAMALIHEKLYQNQDIGLIPFEEYAGQLVRQLAALYPASEKVSYSIDGAGIELDIDTAVPLGLILNELVSNAYKYAFGQGEGQLLIKLSAKPQGAYELVVADDGPGLPEGFDFKKAKSLGLRLVRRLSKQLYGSATYEYNKGTRFTVTFKDTLERKNIA